ncbi:MAG: hypothetical protein JNJ54_16800 [Myxococcaceae bacterium]|nr:hypothetical protein [Myxococcaceae bacterium]
MFTPLVASLALCAQPSPPVVRGAAGLGLTLEAGVGVDETLGAPARLGFRTRLALAKDLGRVLSVGLVGRLTRAAPATAEGSLSPEVFFRLAVAERTTLAVGLGVRLGFFNLNAPESRAGLGPDVSASVEQWLFSALFLKLTVGYAAVFLPAAGELQHRFEQVLCVGTAL